MALTKEQFAELRKKGLTPQQIADFEAGKKPTTTQTTQPQQNTNLGTMEGFTDPFKSTATGIAKGAGKLALGVGTLGRSIQKGVGSLFGADVKENSILDIGSAQRMAAEQTLAPKNTGEKVSSFVTEVAATALPSSAALKATKGLGFARAMLGRGAIGAVTGTVQGGGDVDKDTLIGAGAEVAFPLAGKVIGYGGNVLKGLAGLVSGKGSDVIEQVIKTPQAALEGGTAPAIEGLKETATAIRDGVKLVQKNAGTSFEEATKEYTKPLSKKAFKEVTDGFFREIDESTFIDSSKIDKLQKVVDTWDDYSPQGINKLGSKISKFYSGSASSADVDRVVSGLNRTIRGWVGKQVPEIAEANAKYADKMDLLEQMEAIFRTRGSVDDRLGMQKTAEAISRLFNANKDIAREGVEELEKELGINVIGREAGRQLVDGVTRSQGAIGDVVTGVAKALIPPKLILQVAARTGMAKQAIESRLNTIEPIARATVIEVLTDLFGEGEANQENQTQNNTTKTIK